VENARFPAFWFEKECALLSLCLGWAIFNCQCVPSTPKAVPALRGHTALGRKGRQRPIGVGTYNTKVPWTLGDHITKQWEKEGWSREAFVFRNHG